MVITISETKMQKMMIDYCVIFCGDTAIVSETIDDVIKKELESYGYELSEWSE